MNHEQKVLADKVREFEERTGESVDLFPGGQDNTANLIGEHRVLSEPMPAPQAKKAMTARSRRGFLVGGVAAFVGILGWRWTSDETKASLYERAFRFNERVSQMFGHARLAPEFPPERVTIPARFNGDLGITTPTTESEWRLAITGIAGREDVILTFADLRSLPRTEMTTEFKCIEGWSTVVHWAGVRFADLAARYAPSVLDAGGPRYVSLATPDNEYFVGWDIESILHPQTLLAYEMNGSPLLAQHGAPLRLASPLKYGIKQIKRVGRIEFSATRPRDYWNESGYDWYSGH